MLAVKTVGLDYLSCDIVQVTLGINGPALDPSVALDYTPGNTVTPDPSTPGIFASATFSGSPQPLAFMPAGKNGPAPLFVGQRRLVELSFDESDIIRTIRVADVVSVWLASATVTREFTHSIPAGSDGLPLLSDQDPADYIVTEKPAPPWWIHAFEP